MATRDLEQEKVNVDKFFESQGRAPSSSDDWSTIHSATYGADLPEELKNLPVNQEAPKTPGLSFRGADISDTALTGARESALSYNQAGFTDKVKERLQKKFKPETETLGLGSFSATLGQLDPSGVMSGINEKTGQFRRKGALALQAMSTANDIYSEQAGRAFDKLEMLEGYRGEYEAEQKAVESEFKDLALTIAQTGQNIPEEILSMLPPDLRTAYESLPTIFAQSGLGEPMYSNYSASSGWSGDELIIEQGSGDAYECGYWARNLGNYAGGVGMGNSFGEKTKWVDTYGTRGTEGLQVGDLVITNGADVSANGKPLGTGHALIVGARDADGNIYAYEANAKGNHAVTFGRWVDPSAMYGYVRGDMNPGEMEQMESYAVTYNPAERGKPEVTEGMSELDHWAQRFKDKGVSKTELQAKFSEDEVKQILSRSAELDKTPKEEEEKDDEEFNDVMDDIKNIQDDLIDLKIGWTDAHDKIYTRHKKALEANAKAQGHENGLTLLDAMMDKTKFGEYS